MVPLGYVSRDKKLFIQKDEVPAAKVETAIVDAVRRHVGLDAPTAWSRQMLGFAP
jgi:hypothetical protein